MREGREKRGDSAVGGGAALCMSCAVDPSTELASAVRQLHLGKLQVRKVLDKMIYLRPGLQCPSSQGCSAQRAGAPVLLQLCP